MATQKVTEKILQDAKKEAEEILNKYKKETAAIKDEYTGKIAVKKKQIKSEIETTKRVETLRGISQKRLELNKQVTLQKYNFISEIIEDALKKIVEHKKYFDFLKDMIKKSDVKQGELIISDYDKKKYGSDLEKYMKSNGFNYTIKTDNELKGGIIVKRGKITYLGSLDLIGELLSNELSIAVSKILW